MEALYPKREKFFSHRFTRLLAKCCAANDIGPAGAWLLTVIVQTEDASHYRRGVSFYDGQLMPLLGINSNKTMTSLRKKVVDAGWLHYEPGKKGKASVYWVVIPERAQGIDDAPSDEGFDAKNTSKREGIVHRNGRVSYIEMGGDGTSKGGHYIPIPIPIPHPLPEESNADDGEEPEKPNFIAPASRDPFVSLYPPPLVSEKLPNYTGSVVDWAWEVGCLFAKANPERRNHETAAKIVKRFADTLSRTGQAGFEKLKAYYSLADPTKWQDEVNKGLRLPIGSSPIDVCELLFPKSQQLNTKPSQTRLPTGEELKRREAETLARLGGAMTAEQREAIKAKRMVPA